MRYTLLTHLRDSLDWKAPRDEPSTDLTEGLLMGDLFFLELFFFFFFFDCFFCFFSPGFREMRGAIGKIFLTD